MTEPQIRTDEIHERALRTVCRDTESSFDGLVTKDNSVSAHQRNLQLPMIKIYGIKNSLNPSFMANGFCPENEHIQPQK